MSQISVAIIDDQPLLVAGIESALVDHGGFSISVKGTQTSDLLRIAARDVPDVVLIDPGMPGDFYDTMTMARLMCSGLRVVAFACSPSVGLAIRALDVGVAGYLVKTSKPSDLVEALETVHRGETYMPPSLGCRVFAALREVPLHKAAETVKLSIREREIVSLLLNGGLTNKEIARALKIGEKTVKYHMSVLMQKLHARNRLEVVIAAQKIENSGAPHLQ